MNSSVKNCTKTWALAGSFGVAVALLTGMPVPVSAAMVPDFSLREVNTDSPTYNEPVSARDCLGQVSGWEFGQCK